MQHSFFESLYCVQPPNMEASPLFTLPSPSLHAIHRQQPLINFVEDISCSFHAPIFTPLSSSHYQKPTCELELTSDSTLVNPPLLHSPLVATTNPSPFFINTNSSHSNLTPSESLPSLITASAPRTISCSNEADDRRTCDDGSVASKLLCSITKSMSSPLLQLKSCKEAARETPYQKALKLRQMKLQHCAEALGMESLDNSSLVYDSQGMHQEKIDRTGIHSSFPSSFKLPSSHQIESSLRSVKSSPNLTSAPSVPLMTSQARYTRSTSFPPPLSHTLPTSSSDDSPSISLRAHREGGRFILKETMVPSKHYFQADRRNGRLTLHVFTRDKEEEEHFARQDDREEFSYRELQKGIGSRAEGMGNEEICAKKSSGLESSKEINVAEGKLGMSMQTLNCIANYHNNQHSRDDERNAVSNVITLSLQTSCSSTVTLHKAQVFSFPHISSLPIVSRTLKQTAFMHSTQRSDGFLSGTHAMPTSTLSKESFIWPDSTLLPCATPTSRGRHKQQKGGGSSGSRSGCGDAAAPPTFVMQKKSLSMKAACELATSLSAEARYASKDWCVEGKKQPCLSEGENGGGGTIIGEYASAIIDHIPIVGNEDQISNHTKSGYSTCSISESGKDSTITTPPSSLDLQYSSCNANEEWLHALHCKEIFDRQHLGQQTLMKLHCIPTKS